MLPFHFRDLVSEVIEEELVLFLFVECNLACLLDFLQGLFDLENLTLKIIVVLIFVSQGSFQFRLFLVELFCFLQVILDFEEQFGWMRFLNTEGGG